MIQDHHGRVVDTPGDNILAEFSSALNAVNGAIDIQGSLKIENSQLPDDRRMEFRIGINLGDILHKDDCIYGDGVNVAARIESLAEPGGICISRGVYDQVKMKVRQGFEYLGERAVKNINEPVRIYRILLAPEDEGRIIGKPKAAPTKLKKSASVAIAMVLIASVVLIWLFYPRDPVIWAENYDRNFKDIFALQDEIAMKIMAELQVNIAYESHGRYATMKTTNLKAYEKIIQGGELFLRRTEGDTLQARKPVEEAIALDPEYGIAYTFLGWTHLDDIWFYRTKDRAKSLIEAEQLAHKAMDLSGTDPTSHRLLGCVYISCWAMKKRHVNLLPRFCGLNQLILRRKLKNLILII